MGSLVIVANFLNLILEVVVQRNLDALRAHLRRVEVAAMRSFDDEKAKKRFGAVNQTVAAGFMLILVILVGTIFFGIAENCTCSYRTSREDFGKQDCDATSYETCVATGGFQHNWVSSFYMSVITVTTVGFGDYSPKSELGRAFAIVWMIVGVAVTAYFISSLSAELAREENNIEFEDADTIDKACFHAMDKDGNGYLSKDEYALYVLVKHGLVPRDIVEEIQAKYDTMDVHRNGQITY